jgi:transcriptional regulator with XRE-family HTH domain
MAAEGTGKRANDVGPTGERVAENIRKLREARGKMSTRLLAERMKELGRPIPPTGITRLEARQRRVDSDDLAALSLALGVTPNRLLLPVDGSEAAVTPTVEVSQAIAWEWAEGRSPLLKAVNMLDGGDQPVGETMDDFQRHARPAELRLRDQHTAMQAARDVLEGIARLLGAKSGFLSLSSDSSATEPLMKDLLRLHLNRLIAEVEALVEAPDGER